MLAATREQKFAVDRQTVLFLIVLAVAPVYVTMAVVVTLKLHCCRGGGKDIAEPVVHRCGLDLHPLTRRWTTWLLLGFCKRGVVRDSSMMHFIVDG